MIQHSTRETPQLTPLRPHAPASLVDEAQPEAGVGRFLSGVAEALRLEVEPRIRCRLSVVVPVRDEAVRLPRTLLSLLDQIDRQGRPLDHDCYEVIVLANNCTDDSAAICREFASQHPRLALHVAEMRLPESQASVGHARRILMDEAARRLRRLGGGVRVIASADGDTRVAPDWLATTFDEIRAGADVVAGRIFIDPDDRRQLPLDLRRTLLQRVTYEHLLARYETRLDPLPWDLWPRHRQHFGASLAVTVAAYDRGGGMPTVDEEEDVQLYRALLRTDARVRHSPDVRVWTSGRLDGRVQNGLAGQLGQWAGAAAAGRAPLVEHPATTERRLRMRRRLRSCWQAQVLENVRSDACIDGLASELHVPARELLTQFGVASTFGRLYEHVASLVSGLAEQRARITVPEAISVLRLRLRHSYESSLERSNRSSL